MPEPKDEATRVADAKAAVPMQMGGAEAAAPMQVDGAEAAVPMHEGSAETAVPMHVDGAEAAVPIQKGSAETAAPMHVDGAEAAVPMQVDGAEAAVLKQVANTVIDSEAETQLPPEAVADPPAVASGCGWEEPPTKKPKVEGSESIAQALASAAAAEVKGNSSSLSLILAPKPAALRGSREEACAPGATKRSSASFLFHMPSC